MKIVNINSLTDNELTEVIKIFFDTSEVKSFDSSEKKELFLFRYFGYYKENYSDYFFVALEDVPLGYVCGMSDSYEDKAILELQPQIEYFDEFKNDYPAHLHINVNPLFHGAGVGRELLHTFKQKLIEDNIKGVHIITSPNANNRAFYTKSGFDFKIEKKISETKLLFMGCNLTH